MKCKIYFYCVNELFSQEYANMHHNGMESHDNFKFEWEEELAISSEVLEYSQEIKGTYLLRGEIDNRLFEEKVVNMRIVQLSISDGSTIQVGCSESILDKLDLKTSNDILEISFFLKDYEPYANPVKGIYIASKEFPENLM